MTRTKKFEPLKSKKILMVLLLLLVYVAVKLIFNIFKLQNYEQEIAKQEKGIEEIQQTNIDLNELLAFLSSDKAVGEYARLKLGMKQAGEQAIIITPEALSGEPAINLDQELNNYYKWFKYFVGN